MMTGKYAKVPCISAMHNCLASALRGIRQGPAWHYARHLCMAKYRSRRQSGGGPTWPDNDGPGTLQLPGHTYTTWRSHCKVYIYSLGS